MLFAIDVGNSNMVMGLYDGKEVLNKWRMTTDYEKTSDEFGLFFMSCFANADIKIDQIQDVIIASVVPPIMYSLEHAIRKYIQKNPIIVGAETKTGLKLLNENPKEVGADRIVNAVAACEIYGGAMILVDFGTATTFDAISPNREYLGGVICPGVKISADALFTKASKLPRVEIVKPDAVIGRNTVKSMQSGLLFGYVGQVEYIVKKMKKEMGYDNIKVVATGGLARMFASETDAIDCIDSTLTLEGLRIIYEKI